MPSTSVTAITRVAVVTIRCLTSSLAPVRPNSDSTSDIVRMRRTLTIEVCDEAQKTVFFLSSMILLFHSVVFFWLHDHILQKFGAPLASTSSSTYYFKLESARSFTPGTASKYIHNKVETIPICKVANTYILSDASRLFHMPRLRLVSRRFLRTSLSFFGQPDKTCMLVCVIQRWTLNVWLYGTTEPTDMPCFEFPPKPQPASTTDTDVLWVDINLWKLSKKNAVKSLKFFRDDHNYLVLLVQGFFFIHSPIPTQITVLAQGWTTM